MKKGLLNRISKFLTITLCVSVLAGNNIIASAAVKKNTVDTLQTEINTAVDKNMWVGDIKEKNLAYLDENGEKVVGLKEIEDKTYYFDENGIAQTGWQTVEGAVYYFSTETGVRYESESYVIDGVSYVFNENGIVVDKKSETEEGETDTSDEKEKTEIEQKDSGRTESEDTKEENGMFQIYKGWHYDKGWYYYDENGNKLYGWQKIDGNWYYLDGANPDSPGIMIADCSYVINGRTYFFEGGGVMLIGWVRRPEGWYYTDKNGARLTGWQQIGKYWYYLDPKNEEYPGLMAVDGKKVINNYTYFFAGGGEMQTGWIRYPEGWYYAHAGGNQRFGWIQVGKYWYYLDPKNEEYPGLMAVNGKKVINNYTYFFTGGGEMQTGWIHYPEGWYYAHAGGNQQLGWIQLGKYWYYLDPKNEEYPGLMVSDCELTIGKYQYAFKADGVMRTGWWYKPGEGYHFYDTVGHMMSGWLQTGGKWYYLDPAKNDVMLSSQWFRTGQYWYYLKESGEMATGWLSLYGNKYYLASDGVMRTGWQTIGGYQYYFYKENDENSKGWGVMAKNTIIDGIQIGANGRAATAKDTLDKIYDVGGVGIWNTDYIMSTSQRSALNAAIAAFENRGWPVSFVLVDVNTGQGISYNPTRSIYSASCIKGPYVMSLLNAGYAPDSNMYLAIKYSDNDAYAAIRNYYGSGVFANWLSRAGVSTSQANSWYVTTSALDVAKMWLYGYQTLFGVNTSYSDWARSTYQGVLNSPISSSLSGNNVVYSKSGWLDGGGYYDVHTDGSIVTDGQNPYILTIMSGAPGYDYPSTETYLMENLASQLDAIHHEMTR